MNTSARPSVANSSVEPLESRIAPAFAAVVGLDTLDGSSGFHIAGQDDTFGAAVSQAGDFNGDGTDDFVVAAPEANSGAGAIYVIFGQIDGFGSSFDLSTLNGTNAFKITGESAGDHAGFSVRGAGDFNNDGFDDLIVGAPDADGSGADNGVAYLVFGGPSGTYGRTLSLGIDPGGGVVRFVGVNAGDHLGFSVGGAGEVNGDAYDDLILGAPSAGSKDEGTTFVIFGGAAFTGGISLSSLSGSAGFQIHGEPAHPASGFDVSGAGDINGDGLDDLIVAAHSPAGAATSAYLVFGQSGPRQNPVNLGTLDGTEGFQVTGLFFDSESGRSVSGAGDLNADGYGDLVLVSSDLSNSRGVASTVSTAYVLFGQAEAFQASLAVSEIDGLTVKLPTHGTVLSSSVDSAGDVNGDGIGDLLVGMSFLDKGESLTETHVIFGTEDGLPKVIDLAHSSMNGGNGFTIGGKSTDAVPFTASAAGDVNGDGFADIVVGSACSPGEAFVVYGQPIFIAMNPAHNTVQFTDSDGDRITIKVSKGQLSQDNFVFETSPPNPGFAAAAAAGAGPLFGLKLGSDFEGAKLKVKAAKAKHGHGDGSVRIGMLDASGVSLGAVKLGGSLESLHVGNLTPGQMAIQSLVLKSLGPETGTGLAQFDGPVGSVKVRGEIRNTQMEVHSGQGAGLKKMLVLGSVTNSHVNSEGALAVAILGSVTNSTFNADTTIKVLGIAGDLVDSTITAMGDGSSAESAAKNVIGNLVIRGRVENSQILAGYNSDGVLVNGHASIGTVKVHKDWIGSDLVAGVAAGGDGNFGTGDDLALGGGAFTLASRIAKVIIKGEVLGTAGPGDHFGFVAEEIGRFVANGSALSVTAGPNNDLAGFTFGDDNDVSVVEVVAPV
jgi:FG-GAP repeat